MRCTFLFDKVVKCFGSLKGLYKFPVIIILLSEVKHVWVRQMPQTCISENEALFWSGS